MPDVRIRARRSLWKRALRQPGMLIGLLLVAAALVLAAVGPRLTPFDPIRQSLPDRLKAPGTAHRLGTDQYGRDVLSRMASGAQVSLVVSVSSVVLGLVPGILLGVASVAWGPPVDVIMSRVIDVLLAFPTLILALLVMAIMGPSTANAVIAIAIATSPRFGRLLRGQLIGLHGREYVEAARALGAGRTRVMRRHLLPNAIGPVVVMATLQLASAVLTEANLSFLGLGVQPPTPSWGGIISEGRLFVASAPWLAIFPGLAIMVTVIGFNLLGDGIRDLLDPRLRAE